MSLLVNYLHAFFVPLNREAASLGFPRMQCCTPKWSNSGIETTRVLYHTFRELKNKHIVLAFKGVGQDLFPANSRNIGIIMQLKDHFLFSACFKYFTNNEDVSGSEEAV